MNAVAAPTRRFRTLRDVMRYAVTRFGETGLVFGHGSENAWDEAAYLLLHRLHLPLDRLEPFLDARLLPAELDGLLTLIDKRAAGIPAAYLTHEAWLGDYRFYVDERVLIPRSLIAELLFEALSPWISEPLNVTRVLDLCCGSACLAIIAADVFPNAQVDAADVSTDALAVAAKNIATYGLEDRIRLIASDLFEALDQQRYDLIICNPPYVNDQSMARLPAEYLHEPRQALSGGVDGMDLIRSILKRAPQHLKRHARAALVLEIGHEQEHFDAAFPSLEYTALSTSAGDQQVLYLDAKALKQASA